MGSRFSSRRYGRRSGVVASIFGIHDSLRCRAYGAGFFGPLELYRGKVLMAEDNLEVVEGTAPGRHVIVEFEDSDAARAGYHSPEYKEVAQHRRPSSSASGHRSPSHKEQRSCRAISEPNHVFAHPNRRHAPVACSR